MISDEAWSKAQDTYPPGTVVNCTVDKQMPWGIIVTISGIPFKGTVEIVNFKNNGKMTPEEFPNPDDLLRAKIIYYDDWNYQVKLDLRDTWPGAFANT